MSYGIMAFRVNLARMATRFGNSKSAKRSKARRACLRYTDASDDMEGEATYSEIIKEMIDDSKASHSNLGYKYWYALKGLMEDLGTQLPNSNWYPASADVFWSHPNFNLYDIDSPMEIPHPDDFPSVFVLRHKNMNEELISQLEKEIEDKDQLNELVHWIGSASQYKQDLVLYYH